MHRESQDVPSRKAARFADGVTIVLALVTIALGLYGFALHAPEHLPTCPVAQHWWFLDAAYRTIALFEFSDANLHIPECYPHVRSLAVARLTGPAAIVFVIARLVLAFLREPFDRWRVGRFLGHTVIVGFGEQGRVRALEAVGDGARVVAIDRAPDEASRALARRHKVVLIDGDADHPGVLDRTRIERAKDVVVATGDDARNLAIAQSIAQRFRRTPMPDRSIEVSLGDPVIRRALDGATADGLIDAFAVEDVAAYLLCEQARFFEIADLKGQRRVHVVVIGFGSIGASIAAQILRSGSTIESATTRFSIVCPDTEAARNLLGRYYPGAPAVADIAYYSADPTHAPIDHGELMHQVEASDPITAILVLGTRSADTLPVALAVREAARRTERWAAPIFLAIEHAASLTGFAQPIDVTRPLSQVLHPFEISAHLCTRKAADGREESGKAIHEAYRRSSAQLRAGEKNPSDAKDADVPWGELKRTYRQANRRIADHIPAKLASAGCVVPHGRLFVPAQFDLQTNGTRERLAALEHHAWSIDRQLDGWRAGETRDDTRLIHDCLKPYEKLPEQTKEYDRKQIDELATKGLPRASGDTGHDPQRLVRFDLWVGLIGVLALNRTEAGWLAAQLIQQVLPRLLAAHPDHNITLVSPLAPGGDLIATSAAVDYLAAQKRQHRLIVLEAVRKPVVIKDFEAHWNSGLVGDLDRAREGLTWEQTEQALIAAVAAIEAAPACERVIELDPVGLGATQDRRHDGYQRQSAYLVQRTHVLIAGIKQPLPSRPGGTAEAVTWRRDRSLMPATMPRYPRRPNPAAPDTPGLVLIDVGQQKVRDEPFGP